MGLVYTGMGLDWYIAPVETNLTVQQNNQIAKATHAPFQAPQEPAKTCPATIFSIDGTPILPFHLHLGSPGSSSGS